MTAERPHDPTPMVCRRCGASNTAADRFCGVCGAFLEWEGVTAEQESGPDASVGGGVEAPPEGAEPPEPSADPERAWCGECGTANPPTRTFCQSCGATLVAPARRPIEPPPEDWTGRVFPTPPPAPLPARRGPPSWLLWVAVLGLLAGAVAVAGFQLLRGGGIESDATEATPTPAVPSSMPASARRSCEGSAFGAWSVSCAPRPAWRGPAHEGSGART